MYLLLCKKVMLYWYTGTLVHQYYSNIKLPSGLAIKRHVIETLIETSVLLEKARVCIGRSSLKSVGTQITTYYFWSLENDFHNSLCINCGHKTWTELKKHNILDFELKLKYMYMFKEVPYTTYAVVNWYKSLR